MDVMVLIRIYREHESRERRPNPGSPGRMVVCVQDLVRRLEGLMWTDWHADVRSAGAQALSGTGHGLVIHDSLLDRMTHLSPMIRRDAVRRLGQLGQSLTSS